MSADNGIYVAKFPDGYRVVHAQAIDNLDYYKDEALRINEIHSYFGRSTVIQTKDAALLEAHRMSKDIPILEYGVCYIGELPFWR